MLIEFSVANFRSIREIQRLSMTAGSSRIARQKHSFKTGLRRAPYVLRAAAIYGANASGKTSLVKAIDFARRFVLNSASSNAGDPIRVTPYLRSADTASEASYFELVFAISGSTYQLGFTADSTRVWSEWLFVTPEGKQTQRWIEREYNEDTKEYQTYVNPVVRGERKTWIASTREDALLFSTAVQLNAKPLAMAHHWLQRHMRVIKSPRDFSARFTTKLIEDGQGERVASFLRELGLDVTDIKTDAPDPPDEEALKLLAEPFRAEVERRVKTSRKVYWGHTTDEGEPVYLPLEEESDGTQVLFALAGPWIDVHDNCMTVVIDELHNSLHPFALRFLLDQYFTSLAGKGGQLIFTTHDTFAMDETSLHRDQVWFMNRDVSGSSSLTALSDYQVRSKEPYRMGYLRGRYGGLPFLPHRGKASAGQNTTSGNSSGQGESCHDDAGHETIKP